MCIEFSKVIDFLKDAAPQITGSLLSGLVALFIFYLGYRSTKKREKEKEAQRLKDSQHIFHLYLAHFKRGMEAQIKQFESIIKTLKDDLEKEHGEFILASTIPDASPKTVFSIDQNDVFKFFVKHRNDTQERIALFSKLYISLTLIDEINQRIHNDEKESVERYRLSKIRIEETMDKLVLQMTSAIRHSLNVDKSEKIKDPFYSKIIGQYDAYRDQKIFRVDGIMHNFVLPVSKLIIRNDYLIHNDSQIFINLVQQAESSFSQILEDKKSQLNSFEHWLGHYNKVLGNITRIIEINKETDHEN